MDNQPEAVNPEMVVLARQSRGVSQTELADMLLVSPGWLSKVEGGLKAVPGEKLLRIAEALDYPTEFFLSRSRLYGPGVSDMFHRRRRNVPAKILDKNQAQMEIRRLNLARLLSSVDIGEIEIRTFDLEEFDGRVQDIARAVRASWHLPRGPVTDVTRAIEQARGIVIPLDFSTRRIDATSVWPPNMPPLFFMDPHSSGDRLRFSLCHELGHIVMHQDSPSPYMEEQADQFAAEFLMPEEDIRPYLTNLSLERLATLKPYWKVSMAAILMRARDLGEVTPRHAKTMWVEMGKAGYKRREPMEVDIPVERPALLQEITGVYSNDMGYTLSDLANRLRLHEHEICQMYFGAQPGARDEEREAAIEEAERILKGYRKAE